MSVISDTSDIIQDSAQQQCISISQAVPWQTCVTYTMEVAACLRPIVKLSLAAVLATFCPVTRPIGGAANSELNQAQPASHASSQVAAAVVVTASNGAWSCTKPGCNAVAVRVSGTLATGFVRPGWPPRGTIRRHRAHVRMLRAQSGRSAAGSACLPMRAC